MNNKIINDLIYFLYNECTGDDANKKLFINFIKEVLNKTSLKERTEVELWDLVWDKPIFSGWKVSIASLIAMKHREMGTFQYSIEIPHSAESIPPFRLEGIRGLKEIFPQIYHQYSQILQEIKENNIDTKSLESVNEIRNLLGVTPEFKNKGTIFVDSHVFRVADISVLHMLTDFGFPVCKPDIWVLRISSAISQLMNNEAESLERFVQQRYPEFNSNNCDQRFLETNFHYVFLIMDYLVNHHLDLTDKFFKEHNLDIETSFNRYRFLDLIIAKFGMTLEPNSGIIYSPFDLLEDNDNLKEQYKNLLSIVNIVNDDLNNRQGTPRPRRRLRPEESRQLMSDYYFKHKDNLHPNVSNYREIIINLIQNERYSVEEAFQEIQKLINEDIN